MPLEVLIVEDSPDHVALILKGFKEASVGFPMNIRLAANGEEALRLLLIVGYRPSIILLDLNLPKVDGRTVLQRVRSQGVDLKSIPIVVFSSSEHGIQEILDAGASAYIMKPRGVGQYLKVIEKFVILWVTPLAVAQP
jgi:CheY-like chemotaxis protein